jgi:hypothetical protein
VLITLDETSGKLEFSNAALEFGERIVPGARHARRLMEAFPHMRGHRSACRWTSLSASTAFFPAA